MLPKLRTVILAGARIAALLPRAEEIMGRALFLGTFPGLSRVQMDYMTTTVRPFARRH